MTSSEIRSPESFPLVTVFTLIYNTNPRYVIEAIESVRANNYPNLQHIIIDDCSPNPDPKRVVKDWIKNEGYSCEFYEHEINLGISKTLNHVLELSKGVFIFGCSDDIIKPDRIIKQVELLMTNDGYICHSNYNEINAVGLLIEKDIHQHDYSKTKLDYFDAILNGIGKRGIAIHSPTVMFKTELLKDLGGFSEDYFQEDLEMLLRISEKFEIFYIHESLVDYRVHNSSVSHNEKLVKTLLIDKISLLHRYEIQKIKLDVVKKNLFMSYLLLIKESYRLCFEIDKLNCLSKINQYMPDSNTSEIGRLMNILYINDFLLSRIALKNFGWSTGNRVKDLLMIFYIKV